MTTLSPLSISFSTNTYHNNTFHRARCYLLPKLPLPITSFYLRCTKVGVFHQNLSNFKSTDKGVYKDGILRVEGKLRREKRVVMVRGFGFNGGNGSGNGRKIDGNTARVLTNLALAVGLTYLSMTGQLGWVLDTIVSLWLLAIILPVVGIGAFLWWAGRDMIQSTCPNCGNAFQVFKSSLKDELQLCPFCTQPFSVEGNEFVKEPIQFSSNRSTEFGQSFGDFSPRSRKGKDTSKPVVDIEAEVKDAD